MKPNKNAQTLCAIKKGLSENRQPQINKGERFARISLPYFSAEK